MTRRIRKQIQLDNLCGSSCSKAVRVCFLHWHDCPSIASIEEVADWLDFSSRSGGSKNVGRKDGNGSGTNCTGGLGSLSKPGIGKGRAVLML